MNVGIFTDTYAPEINGVAITVQILKHQLIKNGHNVYIFTTTHPNADIEEPNIFRLPSMPYLLYPQRRLGMFFSSSLLRDIKQLNLDILHTQTEFSLGIFAKIVAKKYNIPLVHSYQSMYCELLHYVTKGRFLRVSNLLLRIFSRWYCNTSDFIVVPTSKVFELLKAYGIKRELCIIPTGIDLNQFLKLPDHDELAILRRQLNIGKNNLVLLTIGRLSKEKRVDVLLNQLPVLIKQHPDLKVLIVGDGPAERELRQLAKKLSLENYVIFTGEIPWNKVVKFYQLSDIYVSTSFSEAQGLTFIEAMACRIPVIAKKDKCIEYLIQDCITGRVFSHEQELPEIISEIIDNKELRQFIVKNAYEKVTQFSAESFAKSIEKVYSHTIAMGSSDIRAN